MRNSGFSKWFNHPGYFFFWLFLGFWALSFCFEKKEDAPTKVTQMSSLAETIETSSELDEQTNFYELQNTPDEELLRQLQKGAKSAPAEDDLAEKYALTPEQIEALDQKIYNSPEYREDFESYEEIADTTLRTQYENPKDAKVCPVGRLLYEKALTSNPKLKDLFSERPEESKALPKKCILQVMNQTSLPKVSLGVCSRATGPVRTPGSKPCVTETLVSATYHSYVDVMECLNLNPKLFFPKIARESGFLINAYGAGKDGGIGQFTQPAIEAVNQEFQEYMSQIEKAAATKPSCARIIKYKAMLTKAESAASNRCAMIAAPENPLRNILYIGIFNRSHMDRFSGMKFVAGQDFILRSGNLVPVTYDSRDEFEGLAKSNKYKESLEDLGIKNPNMHFFKELLTVAGYNMGSPTAIRLFSKYLEKRKQAKKPLTMDDFDFNKVRLAKDTYGDGKERSVIDIDKSFILSSFISPKDKPLARAIKLKKRKQLPREWAASYLKSFPEFLALNANNYDGKQITRYSVYGDPGYVSFVANKNREFRELFNGAGIDPNYCSDPNFLTFKR